MQLVGDGKPSDPVVMTHELDASLLFLALDVPADPRRKARADQMQTEGVLFDYGYMLGNEPREMA